MCADLFQHQFHDVVGGAHAVRIRLQHVGFDQQRGAVLQRRVAGGKARAGAEVLQALERVAAVLELQVAGGQMAALLVCRHGVVDDGVVLPGAHGGVEFVRVLGVPGEVVLVIGAVGGVHVDQEIGQPRLPQLQPRAHLRRVGLDVVAVEVEVLRLAAETHRRGAVLVDAMVGAGILVAVHAEHRDVHQHQVIEQVRVFAGDRDIAQQHQPRILALDLARVNARLHQHHRLVRRACGRRVERAVTAGDHHRHRPAFGRAAERFQMDHARRRLLQSL